MMDKQNRFDAQQQHSQTASTPVNQAQYEEVSPSLPQSSHNDEQNSLKGKVYLPDFVEERTYLLLRWLGYGLLVSAAFDYIHIIIPLRLTNPVWEFQTIGALVEYLMSPFLGLLFVFYRREGYVGKWEKKFLWFLSWLSLVVGVVYLLLVPLGVADTWRIYQANKIETAAQVSQKIQPFQQIKAKLDQATTDEQLKQLVAALTPQRRSPEIKNTQAFKNQLLTKISQAQQSIQTQTDKVGAIQRLALIKNSVKWNLGALVAGTLFIWIWHLTEWARIEH